MEAVYVRVRARRTGLPAPPRGLEWRCKATACSEWRLARSLILSQAHESKRRRANVHLTIWLFRRLTFARHFTFVIVRRHAHRIATSDRDRNSRRSVGQSPRRPCRERTPTTLDRGRDRRSRGGTACLPSPQVPASGRCAARSLTSSTGRDWDWPAQPLDMSREGRRRDFVGLAWPRRGTSGDHSPTVPLQ